MSKECTTHHFACDCREEKFRQLEQENAALRADKERIEWSEKFLQHISEVGNPHMDGTRFVGQYRDSTGRGNRRMSGRSFRDCIDAVRKEAQP